MAMQEYKIVNATQLDSDLAELASKYRDTFGISATTPLTFPESFIETVDNIEKRDQNSLVLVGKNVTALAGYYQFDTTFTLPADYVDTTNIKKDSSSMIFNNENATITAPAGYYAENAIYTLTNIKESKDMTLDESVNTVKAPAGYYKVDATFQLPEKYVNVEPLGKDSEDMTFNSRTVTAPAGYYKENATFTLPESYIDITPVTKSAADVTLEGKTVTVSAGYYTENIEHNLPDSYVDTTDIIITEISDAATIAAALPAGTSITIPAGYYPNAIVITSSQSPEEPDSGEEPEPTPEEPVTE